MRHLISFGVTLTTIFFFFVPTAFAARLPHIEVTEQEWHVPAEQVLHDKISDHALKKEIRFWNDVVDLKSAFIHLHPQTSENIAKEADQLAKNLVLRMYQLSREYKIVGWPYLHNMLIKMKIRQRGYCYHYTEDLLKTLQTHTWQHFDLYWAEAAANTWHESNAVVLTARGQDFADGLVVDAWRKGSKPFWIAVRSDKRWHWKKFLP